MYLNVFKCLSNHNRLLGALVVMSGTIMGSCMFCSFCLLHCWPTLVFLLLPCRLSNAFLKVLTVSTLFTMLGSTIEAIGKYQLISSPPINHYIIVPFTHAPGQIFRCESIGTIFKILRVHLHGVDGRIQ